MKTCRQIYGLHWACLVICSSDDDDNSIYSGSVDGRSRFQHHDSWRCTLLPYRTFIDAVFLRDSEPASLLSASAMSSSHRTSVTPPPLSPI